MRRRPSELYQVDFMAALFGGFLLIWLARATDAEAPAASPSQVPVIVMAHLTFNAARTPEQTLFALPSEAVMTPCLSADLLKEIFRRVVKFNVCSGSVEQLIHVTENRDQSVTCNVALEASKNKSTARHVLARVRGISLRILFPSKEEEHEVELIGRALRINGSDVSYAEPCRDRDLKDVVVAYNVQGVAVGVVSQRDLAAGAPSVEFTHPAVVTVVEYDRISEQGLAGSYRATVDQELSVLPQVAGNALIEAASLHVQVVVDPFGRNRCYGITETEIRNPKPVKIRLTECTDAEKKIGFP